LRSDFCSSEPSALVPGFQFRRSVLIFPAHSVAAGLGSIVAINFYHSHLIFLLQRSSGPLPVLLAPGIFMFPVGAVQHELFRSSSKCVLGFSWLDLSLLH
jgi:hypothetical protein